jgi:hypothetical protein
MTLACLPAIESSETLIDFPKREFTRDRARERKSVFAGEEDREHANGYSWIGRVW